MSAAGQRLEHARPVAPSGSLTAHCTIALVAAILWIASGNATQYPAFGIVIAESIVAAVLFPCVRFDFAVPLSPRNWAIFLFQLHLIVAPLLGVVLGFERGTLAAIAPNDFINAAMGIAAVAHFSFAAGLSWFSGSSPRKSLAYSPAFEQALSWLFIALGSLGLLLTFGGIGGYLRYITVPETHALMNEAPPTVSGALGTFLRPFLPFGIILVWSNRIQRLDKSRLHPWATGALLLALFPATASYNRASMVGPILAVLAAYSLCVRRLSAKAVLLLGLAILAAGLSFGAYRNANLAGPDTPYRAPRSSLDEANEFLQIYGEGPQLLGFLLEKTQRESLHWGRSVMASLLYPVPVVGKSFREDSGVTFFNRLIYGRGGIVDQVIPASGEWLINFHLPGVVAFFLFLGWVIARIQRWFLNAPNAFEAAAAFSLGTWVSAPIAGSMAVLAQLLIYSFWPIYLYYGLRAVLTPSFSMKATQ